MAASNYSNSLFVDSPNAADNMLLWRVRDDIVITGVYCIVDPSDAGESAAISIYHTDTVGDNPTNIDATSISCDNDGANDDGTLDSPNANHGSWVGINVGAVVGAVDNLTVTVDYYIRSN